MSQNTCIGKCRLCGGQDKHSVGNKSCCDPSVSVVEDISYSDRVRQNLQTVSFSLEEIIRHI